MGGREHDAPPAAPHLDDGVVANVLHRLPSKDAYRCTAVCPSWRAIVSEPAFLCRHLSPRPLPLLDDGPHAFILQPPRKVGYTHLTLVPTNPGDIYDLNMPLDPKFTEQYAREILLKRMGKVLPTGLVHTKEPASKAAVPPPVENYVAFFERTVPMLDISFVASHGRLLLGRSWRRYYVCDPAANRWLVLPPSSFQPTHDTASGLHYDINASTTGCLSFTVVLLVRIAHRRVLVDTFSSTTGRWDTKVINTQGVARCLGAASPGIHVGTSFYWLSRRRGRATVLREPPMAEGSQERVGRTLGSTDGGRRLRVCAFDIRDDKSGSMMPHDDIEGVHGVWVMDDDPAGSWRRVHEAVVGDISAYYFGRLCGHEVPVDFAGACSEFIIVESEYLLRRYELGSGRQVTLASLRTMGSDLRELYGSYRAFPFFRPA